MNAQPIYRSAMPYLVLSGALIAVFFGMPDQLALAARVATMAIFVMSLDLVVGIAGLATLGHAANFGVGAYAAALTAAHLATDPILGLLIGAGTAACFAALSGLFLLRYNGLTFLMLTIALAEIVLSVAKKLRTWTGGDDGLSGYTVGKLLGVFSFDLHGRTAFIYTAVLLLASLFVMRRIIGSPFGLACLAIHQNRIRMTALGNPIRPTLLKLYAWAGGFAGLAGAASAQVSQIVGLDSLGFTLSADSLVMLVLGGAGTLYGAIAGTAVFMGVHHAASAANPYHWLFIIGGMLVVLVLIPRDRWASALRDRLRPRRAAPMSPVSERHP